MRSCWDKTQGMWTFVHMKTLCPLHDVKGTDLSPTAVTFGHRNESAKRQKNYWISDLLIVFLARANSICLFYGTKLFCIKCS